MSWDRVHAEAEVLEHVLSEDLEAADRGEARPPDRRPPRRSDPDRRPRARGAADASAWRASSRATRACSCAYRTPTRRCCAISPSAASRRASASSCATASRSAARCSCVFGEREHAIGGELAGAMRVEVDVAARHASARWPGRPIERIRGSRPSPPRAAAAERGGRTRARATARASTRRASQNRRWRLLWLLVGPGILAMLGENDGPSMIAYASDGAQYGLGFFVPLIPVLFAMAFVVQEMCMRVGAVTHRGYGELVLQRYGTVWGWFGAGDLCAHEPDHADRRVRRDPRRARLLPPRRRRRRGARARARRCSPSAAGATGAGSAPCSAWRCSTGCSCSPRSSSSHTSATVAGSLSFTPLPARQPQHAAAAARLDDRRDRDAVDDLLPAERLRRQGHDARATCATAATTPALGAVLAAIFGIGALIAGAALLHSRRLGHPGFRRGRLPGGARARRRRRCRNGVRARTDRGRRGRDPHDLRQHRLRRRRMRRRLAQLQHLTARRRRLLRAPTSASR